MVRKKLRKVVKPPALSIFSGVQKLTTTPILDTVSKSKKSAKSGQEKSSSKTEKSFISADRQNFNTLIMFVDHIHSSFLYINSTNSSAPRLYFFFFLKVVYLGFKRNQTAV